MSVVEEGCSLVRGCCSSGLLEAYIVFSSTADGCSLEKVLSSRMTSASQFMMDIVSYHDNMSIPHAHPMPSSTCPPTVYGARQLDGILPIVSHGMRQNVTNHDTPRYKADM
jgi:hypothetical protein